MERDRQIMHRLEDTQLQDGDTNLGFLGEVANGLASLENQIYDLGAEEGVSGHVPCPLPVNQGTSQGTSLVPSQPAQYNHNQAKDWETALKKVWLAVQKLSGLKNGILAILGNQNQKEGFLVFRSNNATPLQAELHAF